MSSALHPHLDQDKVIIKVTALTLLASVVVICVCMCAVVHGASTVPVCVCFIHLLCVHCRKQGGTKKTNKTPRRLTDVFNKLSLLAVWCCKSTTLVILNIFLFHKTRTKGILIHLSLRSDFCGTELTDFYWRHESWKIAQTDLVSLYKTESDLQKILLRQSSCWVDYFLPQIITSELLSCLQQQEGVCGEGGACDCIDSFHSKALWVRVFDTYTFIKDLVIYTVV